MTDEKQKNPAKAVNDLALPDPEKNLTDSVPEIKTQPSATGNPFVESVKSIATQVSPE